MSAHLKYLALAATLAFTLAACTPPPQSTTQPSPSGGAPTSTPGATTSAGATSGAVTTTPPSAAEASLPPLPPASDFVAEVTNQFYPLKVGSKWVYIGVKDGQPTSDTVVVTPEKKTIQGIQAVVVKDELTHGGHPVESTEDWFAQDKQGNVWYLGEATVSFNADGSVESTEGSWQAGVNGAKAGIFMPASPAVGQSFQQEFYKGVAEDAFTVVSLSATATVPSGSYTQALKTVERTPLEPDVMTEKFYVRGIGMVFENDVTGPPEYNKLVTYSP